MVPKVTVQPLEPSGPFIPTNVLVELTHAEIQVIAAAGALDVLHIKGPALDPQLRSDRATSMDVDILIRPRHLPALQALLRDHGWHCLFDFRDGSTFEHAATWARADMSQVDVHRYFPGFEADAEVAFERLWRDRREHRLAGIGCQVPSLDAQRLILLLHAARGHDERALADRDRAWVDLEAADRERVDRLAVQVGASVALGAVTGRRELLHGARTADLWTLLTSTGTTDAPLRVWWTWVRAEPTFAAAVRRGIHLLRPNRRRLATWLEHEPTRADMLRAYLSQGRRAAVAARTFIRSRASGRRSG